MDDLNLVQKIAVWTLPVLFAITVHETAHGWVAKQLGDPTARMLGRLTLNPIKHIDPVGTLLVPLVMMLLPGNFIFGWAKPVPVTFQNLRHPRRDMVLVAAAGPASNLLMALGWAAILKLTLSYGSGIEGGMLQGLVYMCLAGIIINIVLMVLNLLPLPPLDGGRIVTGLLPGPQAYQFSRIEPYGLFILIGLLATGLLGQIMNPALLWTQRLIFTLFGL